MARGGINKVLVANAREALLSKGQHPSIDAVRIELGNTGSKSTIHRYLKELEEEVATRLDDDALLSQPIKELALRLASRLREEAMGIVEHEKSRYQQELAELTDRCAVLTTELTQSAADRCDVEQRLEDSQRQLSAQTTTGETLEQKLVEMQQQEAGLTARLTAQEALIASLEEKHHHNREALAHYRESVQTQRDQTLRQHDQHIQQLRTEIRALNQTLSIKQEDITLLNKANARLVAELSASQKSANSLEAAHKACCADLELTKHTLQTMAAEARDYQAQTTTLAADQQQVKNQLDVAIKQREVAERNAMKLEAELQANNELMDRLLASGATSTG